MADLTAQALEIVEAQIGFTWTRTTPFACRTTTADPDQRRPH